MYCECRLTAYHAFPLQYCLLMLLTSGHWLGHPTELSFAPVIVQSPHLCERDDERRIGNVYFFADVGVYELE